MKTNAKPENDRETAKGKVTKLLKLVRSNVHVSSRSVYGPAQPKRSKYGSSDTDGKIRRKKVKRCYRDIKRAKGSLKDDPQQRYQKQRVVLQSAHSELPRKP
jgi:hypothetical protein